ncbi:MAG: hypothetical protein M1827_003215 [Pycnora praestabilis]|nr:MAG: hypothetical protein M1827_003215 [Pycnora praestabilis]
MLTVSDDYDLKIRQGPERARVAGVKEKDRKPVDPPPIIQLKIRDDSDPAQNYLQSPYYFMCCNLYDVEHERPAPAAPQTALAGTLVSSLHRLKDIDNSDGGFFVFGDLSVKVEGEYRLRFSLFEMRKYASHWKSFISSPSIPINSLVATRPFARMEILVDLKIVFASKSFPGMSESTFLSRSFGDQGVRLRIRKEPRTLLKRPAPPGLRADDYSRTYPPQMSGDPRMPLGHIQPSLMGQYVSSPSEEYPPGYGQPSMKRQRMSMDMANRDYYERDPRYDQRLYQEQQPPYSAYPQQTQSLPSYGMNFHSQGPHSAPAGPSEYSFRHHQPVQSSASSPYGSPRSQVDSRSPSGVGSGYPSQQRYAPQSLQHIQSAPSNLARVPHPTEPAPHMRHQQVYQPQLAPGPSQQTPIGYSAPPGSLSRVAQAHYGQAMHNMPATSPGGTMAPPPPQRQQWQQAQQSLNQLPPLQSSASQNIPSPALTGVPASYTAQQGASTTQTPSSVQGRYPAGPGPPTSFDSAAQQQGQPGG